MTLEQLAGFGFTVASFEVLGLSAWAVVSMALLYPSPASVLFCLAEAVMLLVGWRLYQHFLGKIVRVNG